MVENDSEDVMDEDASFVRDIAAPSSARVMRSFSLLSDSEGVYDCNPVIRSFVTEFKVRLALALWDSEGVYVGNPVIGSFVTELVRLTLALWSVIWVALGVGVGVRGNPGGRVKRMCR